MQYNIELPQIRDLGTKDQIQELYNYLYRQAELLSYALSNLESAGAVAPSTPQRAADTFASIKGFIMESEDIAGAVANRLGDYVTYEGVSPSGWYYRAWKSGAYEAQIACDYNYPESIKGESLYKSTSIFTIPAPFAIGEDAVITGMCSGDCWIIDCKNGGDWITFRICGDQAFDTGKTFKVYLHIVGKK